MEWRGREGQQKEDGPDCSQKGSSSRKLRVERRSGVAHRGNEKKDSPENPADPVINSSEKQDPGQNVGRDAVYARRQRVKNVSAVELAAGNQVE